MELHHQRMFTRLEIFRHQNPDLDLMLANLLVAGYVDMEAVETGSRRSVIEWSHVNRYLKVSCIVPAKVKRSVEGGCGYDETEASTVGEFACSLKYHSANRGRRQVVVKYRCLVVPAGYRAG
jgi:hypothetical protein